MRILQLTDFYRPTIGGLERHVETLSQELIRLGHEVTVATLHIGDRPGFEVIDGVRVHRLRGWSGLLTRFYEDRNRPFHPTVPDPGMMRALRRIVDTERPDIVHSHSWVQYSYFPLYRKDSGPGHVVTLHDYGLSCVKKTNQFHGTTCTGPGLAKCLSCAPAQYGRAKAGPLVLGLAASTRTLHGRADAYVAISTAVAEASRVAIPYGIPLHVIPSMVPNGLPEIAATAPRPDFLPAEDGYLLFVGTLGRHKGVDVLLDAYRKLHAERELVLIGTVHDRDLDLSAPGITVARNKSNAEVMAAWQRASVAIVPSVWEEPLGQVAVEAMLAQRPVVASDVGGLRDIVAHDRTGILVPPRDPAALADAVDMLLADPDRRTAMGAAGIERARAFEVGAVTPRLVELFERVLRDRAGS